MFILSPQQTRDLIGNKEKFERLNREKLNKEKLNKKEIKEEGEGEELSTCCGALIRARFKEEGICMACCEACGVDVKKQED